MKSDYKVWTLSNNLLLHRLRFYSLNLVLLLKNWTSLVDQFSVSTLLSVEAAVLLLITAIHPTA